MQEAPASDPTAVLVERRLLSKRVALRIGMETVTLVPEFEETVK